jgi:toxin ParE1/3/4
MRGLPLNGYIIFYQVVDNNVEILRVVNGRQDLEALFAE